MSGEFFEALNLGFPDDHLGVHSGTQAEQTANGLIAIEQLLEERAPAVVLAQGDTNAVLSTAIAASKLPVAFGHIEAGIRSFDRSMPEEVNRVLADHVAELCFAPTSTAVDNLSAEGIEAGVYQTGNTIVDACLQHRSIADSESDVLTRFDLNPDSYAVTTIHRPINTDDPNRLSTILNGLDSQEFPVIFPCHPRTQAVIEELGFEANGSLHLVEPLGYLDFLKLETNARVIVTDSGGIQEEASILEVPCLTVRPNTERPETIDAGVNRLIEPFQVEEAMETLFVDDNRHQAMQGASQLYGDGSSGERIVEILEDRYGSKSS
jgi:UDP-N-acetylglucosamine 2-epimerase (non-hydrolysing)